ncbi:MAG TPA: HAD-IIB family hydrolase [Jatrophihabitans sp.]
MTEPVLVPERLDGSPTRRKRIQLLATDLDGTLLRSDNTVSADTRAALLHAAEVGLRIVLVTGRPTRWLWEVADAAGYLGVVVAANGAMTFDLATATVLHEQLLTPQTLAETTSRLRERFPGIRFAVDFGEDFSYEPGYTHDWEVTTVTDRNGDPMPEPRAAELPELTAQPCVKLLAKVADASPDDFWLTSSALLGNTVTVTRSATRALLEISAPGVTKATGLARYCTQHGVDAAEVAAVGDMPNDLSMLEWAGQSYAVANAHPLAQQAADVVLTETNDQEAVAHLIHRLTAET